MNRIISLQTQSAALNALALASRRARMTAVLLCCLLISCKTIDIDTSFVRDEEIYRQIIDQSEDRFAQVDPLELSDEIKLLVDEVIRPRVGEENKVERLQELLYGQEHLGITYSDQKTHTAIETFHAREGNCLSVMNLYIAIARYAGLDAKFQTVDVQPNWDRRGDLLVLSQHINATGRFNAQRRYVVDFTPEISLQQLTSSIISDQEARALYFNNLGVEELIAGNDAAALVYFKNSLFLDPQQSISWNNIGSTYNRMGNKPFAEYAYKAAFDLDDRNATAINNLAKYYRSMGDIRMSRLYEKAIERFNKKNPYYYFALGNLAVEAQNLDKAITSFTRALSLKAEEPAFYLALARVYQGLGEIDEARFYAESAQELIALNAEIYVPSLDKVRIIDSSSILRDSSPGFSIIFDK
ncbi:MAG: Flp pilus assembly protein TadD [Pseudohongiellaceae bacterium]